METIFMNTKKSKTNKPHKFALNLSLKLGFRKMQINMLLFKICLFTTRGKYKKTV